MTQDDTAYLTSESGTEIQFGSVYFVALDTEGVVVKDTDGYVKIYDSEAEAGAEGTATKLQAEYMAGVDSQEYLLFVV